MRRIAKKVGLTLLGIAAIDVFEYAAEQAFGWPKISGSQEILYGVTMLIWCRIFDHLWLGK